MFVLCNHIIFLTCKQQITQILIFELWLFITERIFIIASVFDTAGSYLLYGIGLAVDELQTTPTGLSI
jgi:hypothetical protein